MPNINKSCVTVPRSPLSPRDWCHFCAPQTALNQQTVAKTSNSKSTLTLPEMCKVSHALRKSVLNLLIDTMISCNTRKHARLAFIKQTQGSPLKSAASPSSSTQQWLRLLRARCLMSQRGGNVLRYFKLNGNNMNARGTFDFRF